MARRLIIQEYDGRGNAEHEDRIADDPILKAREPGGREVLLDRQDSDVTRAATGQVPPSCTRTHSSLYTRHDFPCIDRGRRFRQARVAGVYRAAPKLRP